MQDVPTLYGPVTRSQYEKAAQIRLLVCDVDGVLSNGFIYMGNNGEELKTFCTRDGAGMRALLNAGIEIAIITGRTTKLVQRRAANLVFKGLECAAGHFDMRHVDTGTGADIGHEFAVTKVLCYAIVHTITLPFGPAATGN